METSTNPHLILSRPTLAEKARAGLCVGMAALAMVLVVLVALYCFFGSLGAAQAYFQGEGMYATPHVIDLGSCRVGEEFARTVEVLNLDSDPRRLVGSSSTCSCLVASGLPVVLEPGEKGQLATKIRVPPGAVGQKYKQDLIIFTDSPESPKLRIRLIGTVVGS